MKTSLPVYHSGKIHIKAEKCSTCVFRPGNLMNLQPGRVKEMVDGSIADGAGITCHKTIHGQTGPTGEVQEATCRGFVDAYGNKVEAYRLATAMGLIEEVE